MTGGAASRNPDLPTIVSLNPCTDAILAEVADREQILAISHYSHDPGATSMNIAAARSFPATGGTVEEVLALDPDVVVASSFMQPATRNALVDLDFAVATFGIASSIEESKAQVRQLAKLAGHPQRGEALAARMDAALEQARTPNGASRYALVWQQGGIVAGSNSLINELLDRTGFVNQAVMEGMGQADYLSLENVLAGPTEVLLVAGSDVGQRHPVLDKLSGVKREPFDPALLYCGGPTIIRAAARLGEIRTQFE